MKILLIQPKMLRRPMDTSLKARMSPSLALLTIMALTPSEHQVEIINENIERINYSAKVDLVAITVTVDALCRAKLIAGEFQNRGIPVVAGGIHITACPESGADCFDSICVGKAEATWHRLLLDLEKKSLKKIYEDDSTNSYICSPDYHIPQGGKYVYTNVLSTSRGCPHSCDFCYNSCENSSTYINRPIDDVLKDIKAIGRNHILFIDDNFIGNPSWTKEFLARLKPLKLQWSAAVTVNIIKHPQLLDLMKDSGCQSLFIGFESLNPKALSLVNKTQNHVSEYDRLVEEIHGRGIMINASLVFGLPGDELESFQTTLNWLVENKIETATVHIMTPYPGTTLYKSMLENELITDFDLSHYNTAHVVFRHDKMTSQQLYNGYIQFYKQFYSIKNILKRMPENKKQRSAFLFFNLFYRKFGKLTELISKIIPLETLGKLAAKISYRI